MRLIDSYLFRQTLVATFFVTIVLTALVFLTQSLRFIDLVMNAGASGFMIWAQTLLYLPSFFEIIMPISMVASVLFIYNRLTMDSELIVLKSLGFSPLKLARPAFVLAATLGFMLFMIMGWLSPISKTEAIGLRKEIKAQMSSLIFREGIFNEAGPNLMVYIRDRDAEGNLHGLIIHDTRDKAKAPSTIIAARGVLVSSTSGQQVLTYDGSRQEIDIKTGVMRRLDFDRYTIDLPDENKAMDVRWREPDERTFGELYKGIDDKEGETGEARRAFRLELQKRFLVPFLVPGFALIGLSLLLIGSHDRRGQNRQIIAAISSVVLLEILFLGSYNIAKQSSAGFPLMLLTVLLPYLISFAQFFKEYLYKIVEEK
jgi:lipopolysaccharide export system permease protein